MSYSCRCAVAECRVRVCRQRCSGVLGGGEALAGSWAVHFGCRMFRTLNRSFSPDLGFGSCCSCASGTAVRCECSGADTRAAVVMNNVRPTQTSTVLSVPIFLRGRNAVAGFGLSSGSGAAFSSLYTSRFSQGWPVPVGPIFGRREPNMEVVLGSGIGARKQFRLASVGGACFHGRIGCEVSRSLANTKKMSMGREFARNGFGSIPPIYGGTDS